jgi:hypothetical protein
MEGNLMTFSVDSKYIWSRDQMRAFLKHPSPGVQEWAAARILILYPELQEEMLSFLAEASPEAGSSLLDVLEHLPLTGSAVPPLLNYFRQQPDSFDQGRTAMLLVRCGYSLPEDELYNLVLPPDISSTEAGFEYLLRHLLGKVTDAKREEILYGLASGCNSGSFYDLLSDKENPEDTVKHLEMLAEQYRQKLPDVHKVTDVPAALRLLTGALDQHNAYLLVKDLRFPSLIAQLDLTLRRSRLLAESVREHPERDKKESSGLICLLLACTGFNLPSGALQ